MLPRFTATLPGPGSAPLIAVDLGYSNRQRSCGLAWTGCEAAERHSFGDCCREVVRRIEALGRPVLVLEAVLSTYHDAAGNPDIRGGFERGRGWYYGPGVATFAAALEFLRRLDAELPARIRLPLCEALLSFKKTRLGHDADATTILEQFDTVAAVTPAGGSEPILTCIDGPPLIKLYSSAPGYGEGQ